MHKRRRERIKEEDKRDITGIVLVNKPSGISSNSVLQQVKGIFKAKKAGHTGNLDMLASGMLPVCFGRATRYAGYLLNASKVYTVEGKLGIKTASADADSDIISKRDVPDLSEQDLLKVIENFKGEISQVPPMHSALKKFGKPLYKYARAGVEVERKQRTVTIYSIELLAFDKENDLFKLKVECSKGTYIRTLVDDIGDAIGCGAYVYSLDRNTVADFREEDMLSIEEFEQLSDDEKLKHVLCPEHILKHYPKVNIDKIGYNLLLRGNFVGYSDKSLAGLVRVSIDGEKFAGLAKTNSNYELQPHCMIKIDEFIEKTEVKAVS